MRKLLAGLLLSLSLSASLSAQTTDYSHTIAQVGSVRLMNRHPACNPLAIAFDPVWTNNWGWHMPRVLWHGMYAGLGLGLERGGEKLGVPRIASELGVSIALGLGPHARQTYLDLKRTGRSDLNLPDAGYDLLNRSLGAVHSKPAFLAWLAGDLALSCFARP